MSGPVQKLGTAHRALNLGPGTVAQRAAGSCTRRDGSLYNSCGEHAGARRPVEAFTLLLGKAKSKMSGQNSLANNRQGSPVDVGIVQPRRQKATSVLHPCSAD